jgi:hypothetical protein
VRSTEDALGGRAHVDTSRVILVGHSAAGCNANGGLLKTAARRGEITLHTIVAVDVCMGARRGHALGQADPRTSVAVFWQLESWKRDPAEYRASFMSSRSQAGDVGDAFLEIRDLGAEPHKAIVRRALHHALPRLLP